MKKIVGVLLLVLLGGIIAMQPKEDVEMTVSFDVNAATNYLRIRPGSSKSNNPLTVTQLLDFLDTVESEVQASLTGLYDIDRDLVQERLATYQALLDGVTETQFNNDLEFYYSIYESLFELYSYTLESNPVQGRGVWHRPFESDLTEVRTTLADLHAMGINMLFVETFWQGRLIYDSTIPDTFQHYFTLGGYQDESVDYGTNLLLAFIEEGKQYGIEVHAWVENFFVGYGTSYSDSPILNVHPDWALINYDGTIIQKREVNYIFMDPANPETRDYVKAIYGEIAGSFDVASIHLDYIRYPVIANETNVGISNEDNGYTEYAIREFKSLYGYTGDIRELVVTNPQAAADWKEYKKEVISDFVAGVYYTVKNQNPDVYLSTAIFGNVDHAINVKMQDWVSWIEDGFVEMILPMAYYQSSITVRSEVRNLTDIVDSDAFSYAGIAPSFMGYNDHLNTTQIQASIEGNAMGATFFATQNYLVHNVDGTNTFNTKVQNILTNGMFRNEAILPHGDTATVIQAVFDGMRSKADRIYLAEQAMTAQQQTDLDAILSSYETYPVGTGAELNQLISILSTFDGSNYGTTQAANRMNDDIQYLIDILVIKAKRMQFDTSIDISINPDPNTYFPPLLQLSAPTNLEVTENLLTWDSVASSSGYIVTINGIPYAAPTNSFDIREASLIEGTNLIGVYAKGDDVNYDDSEYGDILQLPVSKLAAPENIKITDNVLTFDPVDGAIEYVVKVGIKLRRITTTEFDLTTLGLNDYEYRIEIRAVGDQYSTIDSNYSPYATYKAGELSLEHVFGNLFANYINHSINMEEEETE
jgi:uncharacterized lipoprotein YddW (UPF0748 family)